MIVDPERLRPRERDRVPAGGCRGTARSSPSSWSRCWRSPPSRPPTPRKRASSCAPARPGARDGGGRGAWPSARRARIRSRCGRTSGSFAIALSRAGDGAALRGAPGAHLRHARARRRRRPRQGHPRGQRHARAPGGAAGAVSANSPFWRADATGLLSTRTPIFRAFPRVGIPPHYDGWEDYQREIAFMVESRVMEDYTYLWYDVRPHPKFGTVEVRVCDSQTRVEHTLALAALVQAMVKELCEHFEAGEPLGTTRGRCSTRTSGWPPATASRASSWTCPPASASAPRRSRAACWTACASTPRTSARPPSSRRSTTCWRAATAPSARWWSTRPTTTCAR